MNREKEKELRSPPSEIQPGKQEVMDLKVFSKNGRFYVEGKEGEWVDVTEKWSGEEGEN